MTSGPPTGEEESRATQEGGRDTSAKPESEAVSAAPDAVDDGPAPREAAAADEGPPASANKEFKTPLDAAADSATETGAAGDRTDRPADPPYGLALKAARERMGVAPADVAASLHLEESVIRAMEEGREKELPSRVYVRGYVRAYANLLGLDPDRLAAEFDSSYAGPETLPARVIGAPAKKSSRERVQRRAGLLLGAILVVIVVALAVTLWGVWRAFDWSFATDGGVEGPGAPAWRSEQPERSDVGNEVPAPQAPTDLTTDPGPTELAPDDGAAPAPIAAASSAANLEFAFKEDSWVQVSDRDREVYADLGKAGRTVSVSGVPPFNITIGYAAGVELRYQGEVIALAPHTRDGVAKLVVY